MIKIVYCLHRLPHLDRAQFQDYWRNVHGPLVRRHAAALRIRRYVQAHTLPDDLSLGLRRARGAPEPFDGIAELYYASEEDFRAAGRDPAAREAGRILLEDERRFIDHARSPIWLAREEVVLD